VPPEKTGGGQKRGCFAQDQTMRGIPQQRCGIPRHKQQHKQRTVVARGFNRVLFCKPKYVDSKPNHLAD
jgi:hypothetical protein